MNKTYFEEATLEPGQHSPTLSHTPTLSLVHHSLSTLSDSSKEKEGKGQGKEEGLKLVAAEEGDGGHLGVKHHKR